MSNDWKTDELGRYGEFRNGVNFNREQEGAGLPILKVKDFGELVLCPLDGLDELDINEFSVPLDQLLADDDIVIIRSNGNPALVGRSVVVQNAARPTTFSGFCIRFRPDSSRLDPRFAAYFLRSPIARDRMTRFGSGTGIQNLNQSILAHLPIDLPELGEQRAISDVLVALDDKIEQNRRTGRALEGLARATFKAWFVDFAPMKAKATGATSFPGMPPATFAALPDRLTDSSIGPVPEGWEVRTLAEAFDINPPRRLSKGQDAPYLDMKNMPTDGHTPDTWERRPHGSGMRFINGDTLVARITPCLENGKTAYVDFLNGREVAWGSTEYIVLRPKPPLPEIFAYCLARTPEFREFAIQNMSGTSGRQRVAASALEHYHIAVPDAVTANAFGEAARPLFECIRAGKAESSKLAALRDYLLPRLISGRIRVESKGAS